MNTVRVTCNCRNCKSNAASLGIPAPLAADIPAALAAIIGRNVHAVVWDAHSPSALSAAVRARTGIQAAR